MSLGWKVINEMNKKQKGHLQVTFFSGFTSHMLSF